MRSLAVAALAGAAWSSSHAQAVHFDPVLITGTSSEARRFDIPAAVDVVGGDRIRDQQLRVNLSETLVRVPGLLIQNRQNYAQDLQVSSRGFGARSTFGVRGVRLIQDGMPITMPDGQGQTALFDLDNARQVEVLRGPFSALYGNSSGGVIHLRTEDAPERPVAEGSVSAGSFGSRRVAVRLGGQSGALNVTGNVARFVTDGYREHSAAKRDTANVKLRWKLGSSSTLTFLGNALNQPDTLDPLGLTQAQLDADRRQAGANAKAFDTTKSIEHLQGGVVYEHRLGSSDTLGLTAYTGQRRVVQKLAIPVVAQGATSSGGVVDLDRDFKGTVAEWRHRADWAGRALSLTLGASYDSMDEHRRGYVNDNGVQGELRRDEDDRVHSVDQYVIAGWQLTPALKLSGGVRHSVVKFRAEDHHIVGANPDDSGSGTYRGTMPVIGALYRASPDTNWFASVGKGFETPTFVELAYRPSGDPGLNFDLRAATSVNSEVGVKSFVLPALQASLTAFQSNTKDDIVSAGSSGGRNTFTNAGRTRRRGAELALDANLGRSIEAYAAYTYTDAVFREGITATGVDLAGKRLPGVPKHMLHAEVTWRPAAEGPSTALELRATSKVFVSDANIATAKSYQVVNWRAGWRERVGAWRLDGFVRVDNLLDERYVGSVIVNEANQRYFEPAPSRSLHVGANASYSF